MISGLPRPAIAGSARLRAGIASLRSSGIGLISVFIGEKPDTIMPGAIGHRKRAAPRLQLGRRPRSPLAPPAVASRSASAAARRWLLGFGFGDVGHR